MNGTDWPIFPIYLLWTRASKYHRETAGTLTRRLALAKLSSQIKTVHSPTKNMPEIRLTLRALIYRDDDCWVAHCLETDVVAEGETPVRAFENLQSLTNMQIETAIKGGDLQSIFRQAPTEILSAFAIGYDRHIRRRLPKSVERFDVRTLQPN